MDDIKAATDKAGQCPASSFTSSAVVQCAAAKPASPRGGSIGSYSGNSSIPEKEGDLPLSVWKDTLVIEDPEYILEYGLDVEDFVGPYLQ